MGVLPVFDATSRYSERWWCRAESELARVTSVTTKARGPRTEALTAPILRASVTSTMGYCELIDVVISLITNQTP